MNEINEITFKRRTNNNDNHIAKEKSVARMRREENVCMCACVCLTYLFKIVYFHWSILRVCLCVRSAHMCARETKIGRKREARAEPKKTNKRETKKLKTVCVLVNCAQTRTDEVIV